MTNPAPTDVLLGLGFGDPAPGDLGILTSMLVRTQRDGRTVEGIRDPILIHRDILVQLVDILPNVLEMARDAGIEQVSITPPRVAIAWNAGPKFKPSQLANLFFCTGISFHDLNAGDHGITVYIEAKPVASPDSDAQGGDYLMDYSALLTLSEALPRVLASDTEASKEPDAFAFDFAKLNFKWDARKNKVTMNRGYLGEFLRDNGVMSLPGMQDLVDLLANLYFLHRKQGGEKLPQFDAFLHAQGMEIKEHDPATITPARRKMDNAMDSLLLAARTKARETSDPAEFWRWLDAEVAPIQEKAEEEGEIEEFDKRYGEVLQLAKDAGLMGSEQ